jgi:DNA modification methylase
MIVDSLKPLCVPIDSVKPDPKNARNHPDINLSALRKSLDAYGQRKPIIVNKETGIIEAGNGMWEVAKSLGWSEIAAVFVEDSSEAAAGYAIADNRTGDLSEFNLAQLIDTLQGFDAEVLATTGFAKDDLSKLIADLDAQEKAVKEETFDVEKAVGQARETATSIKPGQIYQLGTHRLMCGDSTKREDAEKLMAGEKAAVVFTDPPYNVDYKSTGGHRDNLKQFNDDFSEDGYRSFLTAVIENITVCTGEKVPVYFWHANTFTDMVLGIFKHLGYKVQPSIIWLKEQLIFSYSTYHRCYEMMALCRKGGHRPFWNLKVATKEKDVWMERAGFMDYLDVWYVPRDKTSTYVHPTQKPTALAERACRNSSLPGDIVLDFFGGSGSTLIGAERTGRRAFLMELDPHYCQVIVDRWKDFAGKEPLLLND